MKWIGMVVTWAVQVMLTLAFLYGSFISLNKYLKKEIAPSMSFELASSAPIPSIALVPWPRDIRAKSFEEIYRQNNLTDVVLAAGAKFGNSGVNLMDPEAVAEARWDMDQMWYEGFVWSGVGVEKYFALNPPKLNGTGRDFSILLVLDMKVFSSLAIVIHNQDEMMGAGLEKSFAGSLTMTDYFGKPGFAATKEIEVSRKRIVNMNSPETPCRDDDARPKARPCMQSFVAEKIGCVSPTVKGFNHLRTCNSQNDTDAFSNLSLEMIGKNSELVELETGCLEPCSFYQFSHQVHMDIKTVLEDTEDSIISITLFLDDRTIPMDVYSEAYSLSNLFADIGGYMGLLLGASVLSFYQRVVQFMKSKHNVFGF